jgi:hypothetical protein
MQRQAVERFDTQTKESGIRQTKEKADNGQRAANATF